MDNALFYLPVSFSGLPAHRDPPPPFTPPENKPVVPICRGSASNARTWDLDFYGSGFT